MSFFLLHLCNEHLALIQDGFDLSNRAVDKLSVDVSNEFANKLR